MGSVSSAVDPTAVARVVGIKDTFVDLREGVAFLPQHIMLVGQGSSAATYATTPKRFTSALEVAETYGFGSPLHLAMLQIFPDNGLPGVGTIPVTVFPLEDNASGVASTGNIAMTGTQTENGTYSVVVNGIRSQSFAITNGTAASAVAALMVTAIQAVLEMPVTVVDNAGVLEFTSKWEGVSANDIYVEVDGPDSGITFTVTQASGGAANPDVTTALTQADPNVWYTLGINCLNISDTTALDAYENFGIGRTNPIHNKRMTFWTGNTIADRATANTVADNRKLDEINGQRVSPGSVQLPLVVAARQVALGAVISNSNPPVDFGSVRATGLIPGPATDQWDYEDRDAAVKEGSSTIEVIDGEIYLSDTVTFYHKTGEVNPPYRYLVDIVKISNIIFNIGITFKTPEWDGAPLIPDDQATQNKAARKPVDAVTDMYALIDSFALNAWISDPDFAKDNTNAAVDEMNAKRLDVSSTMKIAGNVNILSVDFNWGFYYGTAQIVSPGA